jgi:hypothetical protein
LNEHSLFEYLPCRWVPLGRVSLRRSVFSGQAMSIKHSISRKSADFDGAGFPTEIVYDLLWCEEKNLRR